MRYRRWHISRGVLCETENAFRRGRHEVFVLWTASLDETIDAHVSRCIVPEQTPGVTPNGVYVHIKGEELQRIQIDNYQRNEFNVVQLHTHPSPDVRMSDLDREWEVARHVGALSIIVPSYCQRGLLDFPGANIYERDETEWRLWDRAEVKSRLIALP